MDADPAGLVRDPGRQRVGAGGGAISTRLSELSHEIMVWISEPLNPIRDTHPNTLVFFITIIYFNILFHFLSY